MICINSIFMTLGVNFVIIMLVLFLSLWKFKDDTNKILWFTGITLLITGLMFPIISQLFSGMC